MTMLSKQILMVIEHISLSGSLLSCTLSVSIPSVVTWDRSLAKETADSDRKMVSKNIFHLLNVQRLRLPLEVLVHEFMKS